MKLKDAKTDTPVEIDYDILPSLVGYHLRRAQIAVFTLFAETMADEEITPGQFGVLVLICANPGLTQSALAQAVGIRRSTMVAVIDGLERRGLVERRPSPADRRSYALILSPSGVSTVSRLKKLVAAHESRLLDGLGHGERNTLIDFLKHLAAPR